MVPPLFYNRPSTRDPSTSTRPPPLRIYKLIIERGPKSSVRLKKATHNHMLPVACKTVTNTQANLARSKTQISLSSARAAVRSGRDGPERSGHSCASLLVETVRSGRVGTVRDGPGTRAQACSWGRSGRFGDGPGRSGRSGTDSYLYIYFYIPL